MKITVNAEEVWSDQGSITYFNSTLVGNNRAIIVYEYIFAKDDLCRRISRLQIKLTALKTGRWVNA